MSKHFSRPISLRGNLKVELDLSNYAKKVDLKKRNRCKTHRNLPKRSI